MCKFLYNMFIFTRINNAIKQAQYDPRQYSYAFLKKAIGFHVE